MFSNVTFLAEKPQLRRPILIEGLPGIGYVANIVALHLINELKARKFCEIHSPHFHAFSLTSQEGTIRYPINELYYAATESTDRDIIILFGNSQAGDTRGQYALCKQILDIAQGLGCESVLTIGGLRRDTTPPEPKVFCAASDPEMLKIATDLGADRMNGHIYGVAGLLIGLARLRKMKGLCALSETSGVYADVAAARSALRFMCRFLRINVDFSRLDQAVEANKRYVSSFSQPRTQMKRGFPTTI